MCFNIICVLYYIYKFNTLYYHNKYKQGNIIFILFAFNICV